MTLLNKSFGFLKKRPLISVIVISILIHLLSGVFFGGIVLFDMLTPDEPVLEAPPMPEGIEPQKREYKIKLQKSQQSSSAPLPAPIVANVASDVSLENLDLNLNNPRSDVRIRGAGEGNGIGKGFGDGYGSGSGFDLELTDFGYKSFVAGTLEGKLYDMKYDPKGKLEIAEELMDDSMRTPKLLKAKTVYVAEIVNDFTKGSWDPRGLNRNYLSPDNKLFASYWIIPMTSANAAPAAFSAGGEITPSAIMAHYHGSFLPEETGRFRFVGRADDVLIVKVGSRIVLDGSLNNTYSKFDQERYDEGPALFGIKYPAIEGRWMNWKEGIPLDIDVLIGEAPGGFFGAYLLYQKEGEDRLRIFSTKPLSDKEKQHLRNLHGDARNLL